MDKLGPFEFGKVHLVDMREGMKQIPEGSVRCIWTDPPYGISYQDGDLASCVEQALGHKCVTDQPERTIANDDYKSFSDVVVVMLDQAARVLAKDAAVCCCCCGGGGPSPVFADVAKWMDARLAFDQAVVWDKGMGGLGWRYRRNYEFVMVAHRKGGRMSWYDQSAAISNVLQMPQDPREIVAAVSVLASFIEQAKLGDNDAQRVTESLRLLSEFAGAGPLIQVPRIIPRSEDHPTPKPVELVEAFLKLHTLEGDIVIDPFSGGGTTGVACARLKRRFVGFEIDPKWVEYSNKRIKKVQEKLGLSAEDAEEGQQIGIFSAFQGLKPPSVSKTQQKMDFGSAPEPAGAAPEVPAAPAAPSSDP